MGTCIDTNFGYQTLNELKKGSLRMDRSCIVIKVSNS